MTKKPLTSKVGADATRGNTAISSDDPEAVEKLEAKLKALQDAQERDKALNAYYRKHKTVKGFPGISDAQAAKVDARLAELREALRRPAPPFNYQTGTPKSTG